MSFKLRGWHALVQLPKKTCDYDLIPVNALKRYFQLIIFFPDELDNWTGDYFFSYVLYGV